MRRTALALSCAALFAAHGFATTPESKSVQVAGTPGLSDGVPGEGKEEAKAPVPAPDVPTGPGRSIWETYMDPRFSAELIAAHQAHLASHPDAQGDGTRMSIGRLRTLGGLAQIIKYTYNHREEVKGWNNLFNQSKRLPSRFIHAKVNVPEHLSILYPSGGEIRNIRIIVGHPDRSTEMEYDESGAPFNLNDYLNNKWVLKRKVSRLAIIVTMRDNTRNILSVQDSSMVEALGGFFKQNGQFYEQAHMNTWPAFESKYWIELPYSEEASDYYDKTIHPKVIADVLEGVSDHPGAMVLELGAGTGELTMDIFDRLYLVGKEAYVFGTELLPENVYLAKNAAKECVRTPTLRLSFHPCDSMHLLDEFSARVADEWNAIHKQYRERHGQDLPLVVVSSGALNRLVLNNVFESSRVMQNLFRLNPDLMIASGLTDTLLTPHIIKRTGFATLACDVIRKETGTFSYRMRSKTRSELLKYHETKLRTDPSSLDLSLSPDPLGVLRGLRPEQLAGIRFLDVSHAFFRGEAEAGHFLELAMASCPELESLLHQFGLPGDGIQMAKAMAGLSAKDPGADFLMKITSVPMVEEQNIAFSRSFIKSLTGCDASTLP